MTYLHSFCLQFIGQSKSNFKAQESQTSKSKSNFKGSDKFDSAICSIEQGIFGNRTNDAQNLYYIGNTES